MAVISFDIGGVLSSRKHQFHNLMKKLRAEGHRVVVVTAIGDGSIIPPGERERWAFSHGRLYELGYNLGRHYDQCETTMDWGTEDIRTGQAKGGVLVRLGAACHVDDQPAILKNIATRAPRVVGIHFSESAHTVWDVECAIRQLL